MPIHDRYSSPTAAQFEAIGRITVTWSALEYTLEVIIQRLALAPDYLGLALSKNLSIDNRLEAMRHLVGIHLRRYDAKLVPEQTLARLAELPKQIAKLKDRRNKVIHRLWLRNSDTSLIGLRFTASAPEFSPTTAAAWIKAREISPDEYDDGTSLVMTVKGLNDLADEISALTDEMSDLWNALPGIDEEWICRSLIRGEHLRRSDARSTHPNQR